MLEGITTIGIYGYTETTFSNALQAAGVDTFVDIRSRRGVRGSEYAFANSTRLQQLLKGLAIRYVYIPTLAPSLESRHLQHLVDRRTGTQKRARKELSGEFIRAFQDSRLAAAQPQEIVARIGIDSRIIALCCVEKDPEACHRSLVAAWLSSALGIAVENLVS